MRCSTPTGPSARSISRRSRSAPRYISGAARNEKRGPAGRHHRSRQARNRSRNAHDFSAISLYGYNAARSSLASALGLAKRLPRFLEQRSKWQRLPRRRSGPFAGGLITIALVVLAGGCPARWWILGITRPPTMQRFGPPRANRARVRGTVASSRAGQQESNGACWSSSSARLQLALTRARRTSPKRAPRDRPWPRAVASASSAGTLVARAPACRGTAALEGARGPDRRPRGGPRRGETPSLKQERKDRSIRRIEPSSRGRDLAPSTTRRGPRSGDRAASCLGAPAVAEPPMRLRGAGQVAQAQCGLDRRQPRHARPPLPRRDRRRRATPRRRGARQRPGRGRTAKLI